MPGNQEYFKKVRENYDIDEELRAVVWTAQSFVELGIMTEPEAISEFKLTEAIYHKYKAIPES